MSAHALRARHLGQSLGRETCAEGAVSGLSGGLRTGARDLPAASLGAEDVVRASGTHPPVPVTGPHPRVSPETQPSL